MLMPRYQKLGQKHNKKVRKRSFEDCAEFEYLGKTLIDTNYMHEEIRAD
jgi:hypothetical protein